MVRAILVDVLDFDPQGLAGAGHSRTEPGPFDTADGDRRQAAGQFTPLGHLGDHADRRVAAVDEGQDRKSVV